MKTRTVLLRSLRPLALALILLVMSMIEAAPTARAQTPPEGAVIAVRLSAEQPSSTGMNDKLTPGSTFTLANIDVEVLGTLPEGVTTVPSDLIIEIKGYSASKLTLSMEELDPSTSAPRPVPFTIGTDGKALVGPIATTVGLVNRLAIKGVVTGTLDTMEYQDVALSAVVWGGGIDPTFSILYPGVSFASIKIASFSPFYPDTVQVVKRKKEPFAISTINTTPPTVARGFQLQTIGAIVVTNLTGVAGTTTNFTVSLPYRVVDVKLTDQSGVAIVNEVASSVLTDVIANGVATKEEVLFFKKPVPVKAGANYYYLRGRILPESVITYVNARVFFWPFTMTSSSATIGTVGDLMENDTPGAPFIATFARVDTSLVPGKYVWHTPAMLSTNKGKNIVIGQVKCKASSSPYAGNANIITLGAYIYPSKDTTATLSNVRLVEGMTPVTTSVYTKGSGNNVVLPGNVEQTMFTVNQQLTVQNGTERVFTILADVPVNGYGKWYTVNGDEFISIVYRDGTVSEYSGTRVNSTIIGGLGDVYADQSYVFKVGVGPLGL